jgi:hypothetical protein
MTQPPGFRPLPFQRTGRLLLVLGLLGLILTGVSGLTGWFALPTIIQYMSLAAIVLSLYLIFVVPKEEDGRS